MKRRLIDRLFRIEHITGGGDCPTYMIRWTLISVFGFRVYLHKFVASDWSRDFHDHPKSMISIGLRGRYIEQRPTHFFRNGSPPFTELTEFRAPWVRKFPADHVHRIIMAKGETCWTMLVAMRPTREWGFWNRFGDWMPWRDYLRSAEADDAREC